MFKTLIVDDEAPIRQVARRFLTPEGYEIDEAANAIEALGRIEATPPAVVLLDVHMPGPNGLWLADQIRAISPTTAIVLVTGDADVPPYESLRKGVIAYVLKPLNRRELVRIVDEAIAWSVSEAESCAHPEIGRESHHLLAAG